MMQPVLTAGLKCPFLKAVVDVDWNKLEGQDWLEAMDFPNVEEVCPVMRFFPSNETMTLQARTGCYITNGHKGVNGCPATGRQIKAVLTLLFAFLITLLGALCYALFSFLTAAPEPPVHTTSITNAPMTTDVDELDTDESSTDESTTMMPPRARPRPVPTPSPPRTQAPAPPTTTPTTKPPDSYSCTTDHYSDSCVPAYHTSPNYYVESYNSTADYYPGSQATANHSSHKSPDYYAKAYAYSNCRTATRCDSRTMYAVSFVHCAPALLLSQGRPFALEAMLLYRWSFLGSAPFLHVIASSAAGKRPMGAAPLFCTIGVHMQDYDKMDLEVCDYAFIPYYVRGRDTFVDDSNRITKKLLNKAVASTKTSYAISVPHANRTAALSDLKSSTGQATISYYWTLKNVFHYGVFDIGVQDHEVGERTKIFKEAFDLLKAFRDEQEKLKVANPSQKRPARGFVVAGFYLWQDTKTPALRTFESSMRTLLVDAVIIVTHLTVDEHQANLECFITGGAPYTITSKNPNLYGMVEIMKQVSKQMAWTSDVTLVISVSLCTRVYMPEKTLTPGKELDIKCVDHLRRPNTTAAFCNDPMSLYSNSDVIKFGHYTGISVSQGTTPLVSTYETNETVSEKYCMLRDQFDSLTFGLALFDVECEDWERKCSVSSTPIAGKDRFNDIVSFFRRVSKLDHAKLPCK
ncbi:hypothetical protein HPB50_003033 [Hyalomma asiaticum]|uniref:Uncharacterized protein n=1 Tax=Hyalomma asiaticum TaxID=266040 RepID=A0ACB7SBZ2_HYAAI|nr:hypothetical protein HPB50_003033 [Hyalomma asiaticum]